MGFSLITQNGTTPGSGRCWRGFTGGDAESGAPGAGADGTGGTGRLL